MSGQWVKTADRVPDVAGAYLVDAAVQAWKWYEPGKGWSGPFSTRRACEVWKRSYTGNAPGQWREPSK